MIPRTRAGFATAMARQSVLVVLLAAALALYLAARSPAALHSGRDAGSLLVGWTIPAAVLAMLVAAAVFAGGRRPRTAAGQAPASGAAHPAQRQPQPGWPDRVRPPWSPPRNGYARTLLRTGDGLVVVFREQEAYVAGVN